MGEKHAWLEVVGAGTNAPEHVEVETKIDDEHGRRNVQTLVRNARRRNVRLLHAHALAASAMTPSPKSTIRDGKWVVVQMIRVRDDKAGWRETEVKDERK